MLDLQNANKFAEEYNLDKKTIENISILDSTLREGEQSPGIYFTLRQRIQLAWMLDYFGVNAIEISPIISNEHEESCKKILKAGLNATIVLHNRALKEDIDISLRCNADYIAMYHSVSDIHLKYKLRTTREKTLERSIEAIEYAKSHGLKLRFTMEDASRADPEFLKVMCEQASKLKVDRISIPDTLGVLRPSGMYNLIKLVRQWIKTPIDLHCHNDLGLALANSLAGLEAGASQIHTTINGIGERVGITSLAEIILTLKLLYQSKIKVKLDMLKELSDNLEEYTNIKTSISQPIVGENAYKHKAGTHVSAVIRNSAAYEIIPPNVVGNQRRIIFGGLSGKNGAAYLLKVLGLNPNKTDATNLARGLKNIQKGDLFELKLTKEMESEVKEIEEVK